MKKFIIIFLLLLFVTIPPIFAQTNPGSVENLEGKIEKVVDYKEYDNSLGNNITRKDFSETVDIKITSQTDKDKVVTVKMENLPVANTRKYAQGDEVTLTKAQDEDGNDVYYISGYVRRTPIYLLLILFVVITLLIGRKRGFYSIVGMIITFVIIIYLVIPLILKGIDPVIVAIGASLLIIPITFYLSHGFNKKTTSAAIATVLSLFLIGILSTLFVELTKLTGATSEALPYLNDATQAILNVKGLLLAGMILGVLGILDDITISQSAVVNQLKLASQGSTFKEIYFRAMDIGRDHIASMVNTLVLVYAGASMPLLLLLTNNSINFSDSINYEVIAEEFVRTLVGSIGLIAAVPISTLIACWILFKKPVKGAEEHVH